MDTSCFSVSLQGTDHTVGTQSYDTFYYVHLTSENEAFLSKLNNKYFELAIF